LKEGSLIEGVEKIFAHKKRVVYMGWKRSFHPIYTILLAYDFSFSTLSRMKADSNGRLYEPGLYVEGYFTRP
jgi:hypothetical protein